MEALGIQSQLAGTKVSQLNQAWDAWIGSVTGQHVRDVAGPDRYRGHGDGRSGQECQPVGVDQFHLAGRGRDDLHPQGHGRGRHAVLAAATSPQPSIGELGPGIRLRTGMAEGVVTGGQFKSTVQGLVGEMIPFVAGNRTATEMLANLAHEAGGPVTTSVKQLANWTGVKGKAAADSSPRASTTPHRPGQHVQGRPEPVLGSVLRP